MGGEYDKIGFAIRMHERPTRIEMLFDRVLRQVLCGRTTISPQRVLSGYIVDFLLPELKIIFEVDGPIHNTDKQRRYDAVRDTRLRDKGYQLQRFTYRDLQCPIPQIECKIRASLMRLSAWTD